MEGAAVAAGAVEPNIVGAAAGAVEPNIVGAAVAAAGATDPNIVGAAAAVGLKPNAEVAAVPPSVAGWLVVDAAGAPNEKPVDGAAVAAGAESPPKDREAAGVELKEFKQN